MGNVGEDARAKLWEEAAVAGADGAAALALGRPLIVVSSNSLPSVGGFHCSPSKSCQDFQAELPLVQSKPHFANCFSAFSRVIDIGIIFVASFKVFSEMVSLISDFSVHVLLCHVPLFVTPMDCSPPGSSVHEDFPGKNTGVGCHALLQGIFLIQRSNPSLHIADRFFTI